MKRLNVIVNGIEYEVAYENLPDGEVVTPKKAQVAAPQAPAQAAPAVAAGEGTKVTAPMPGNMWKVLVKQGQKVKKGDALVILEAMKMENEIMSPCDGTVVSLHVTEGATVNTDALIAVIG